MDICHICKCECKDEFTRVTVHTCLKWDKGYTPKPEFNEIYCSDCAKIVREKIESVNESYEVAPWE